MRTTAAAALGALAIVLAGCSGQTEPSDPPSPTEALTTSSPSSDPEPTTEAPPPATESPTDAASTELPAEATEDTEAGAEAFALHYIDLINATGRNPQTGVLEPLGADGCKSCANHEESVAYGSEHGHVLLDDTFEIGESTSLFDAEGKSAVVRVDVTQSAQPYYAGGEPTDRSLAAATATLVFRLAWQDSWLVQEITVDE